MLEVNEIKKMNKEQIDAELVTERRKLFEMNLKKSTSGLEKAHELKAVKKNIARLLTFKNSEER